NVLNTNFITYKDEILTIDILGGVNVEQVERLVCTLRISHANFPPFRTTLDLYNDQQTDKLNRSLCDRYELKLLEVSKSLHALTLQLEEYRINSLRFGTKKTNTKFDYIED
ncbi:MAG: hypothetical protein ACK43K_05080, partial [Chitinophagales bacterium]